MHIHNTMAVDVKNIAVTYILSHTNKPGCNMLNLIKLGLNDLLLEDLIRLSKNNPDQMSVFDETIPKAPVSMELLTRTKRPKKLFRALFNLGIYNIINTDIVVGEYNFLCKERYGRILKSTIPKKEVPNYKYALVRAIQEFKDDISKLEPLEIPEVDMSQNEQYLQQLKDLNVDMKVPDGLQLNQDMVDSIKDLLQNMNQSQDVIYPDNQ